MTLKIKIITISRLISLLMIYSYLLPAQTNNKLFNDSNYIERNESYNNQKIKKIFNSKKKEKKENPKNSNEFISKDTNSINKGLEIDTLSGTKKNETRNNILKKNNNVKKIQKPNGAISMGYLYGVHPFFGPQTNKTGMLNSEGKLGLGIGPVPINVEFFFSNNSSPSGPRNFFRASLDQENLRNQLARKSFDSEKLLKHSLDSVTNIKDGLSQKRSLLQNKYDEELKKERKTPSLNTSFQNPNLSLNDSLGNNLEGHIPTLNDSLDRYKLKNSSKIEESSNKINEYKSKLQDLDAAISKLESSEKIYRDKLETIKENKRDGIYKVGDSKVKNLMNGLTKVNIGLSNPDYGHFLIKGAVNGLDLSWKNEHTFVDFTSGRFQHNLINQNRFLNNRILAKVLSEDTSSINVSNEKRYLLGARAGFGKPTGKYIALGILQGWKKTDNPNAINPSSWSRNFVWELSSNWKYKKINLSGGFARSISPKNISNDLDPNKQSSSFFDATAAELKLRIPKILPGVDFKSSIRKIGKDFSSYGLLVVRKNTLRYDASIDWKINRRFKYSVGYRQERDSQLEEIGILTELRQLKNTLQCRVKKGLVAILNVSPVTHIMDSASFRKTISDNWIAGVTIINAISKNSKEWLSTLGYNYSNLRFNDTSFVMGTLTFQQSIPFSKKIKGNLNFIRFWFPGEHDNSEPWFVQMEITGDLSKKLKLSFMGRSKMENSHLADYGFRTALRLGLKKSFDVEVFGERVLAGDYYASLPIEMVSDFPWNFGFKLINKF